LNFHKVWFVIGLKWLRRPCGLGHGETPAMNQPLSEPWKNWGGKNVVKNNAISNT
jgi:hypothetical protein